MVPRVPAAPNLFVHPPADLRKVLLPPSSRGLRVCSASTSSALRRLVTGPPYLVAVEVAALPRASSQRSLGGRCRLLRLRRPRVCPALVCASFCFVTTGVSPLPSPLLVCFAHRVDSFSCEHQPEARPAAEPLPKSKEHHQSHPLRSLPTVSAPSRLSRRRGPRSSHWLLACPHVTSVIPPPPRLPQGRPGLLPPSEELPQPLDVFLSLHYARRRPHH